MCLQFDCFCGSRILVSSKVRHFKNVHGFELLGKNWFAVRNGPRLSRAGEMLAPDLFLLSPEDTIERLFAEKDHGQKDESKEGGKKEDNAEQQVGTQKQKQ
jgi:hypothetical protein